MFLPVLFFLGAISFDEGMSPRYIETYRFDLSLFKTLYEKNNYTVVPYSEKPLIPKIIHQIWLGGAIPKRFEKFMESWKIAHPSWEYKLWTEKDLAQFSFKNKTAFDLANSYGMKSDIWRYEILDQYGGLYVDVDFECLKPFDPFHHTSLFYTGLQDEGVVGNGLIGAAPHHPLIHRCVEQLSLLTKYKLTVEETFQMTGCDFFTRILIQGIQAGEGEKVVIYPKALFFPFPSTLQKEYWDGNITQGQLTVFLSKESFAYHTWAESW
ncbi:MAG: hypothetical protein KBC64_05710 [Simkaniaceae bacterium]|nr:hypothetical protein [Simkaniaceae bacterium]